MSATHVVGLTGTATATASASAHMQVKTHLWITWAGIAIRNEADARAARADLSARTAAQGWDMARELEPAMMSIAAVVRNPALHHRPEFSDTVSHPTLPTNVSPEYATYTSENASSAVAFMLDVFQTCIAAPKREKPDVVKWAHDLRPSVEQLVAERNVTSP
jgi:hypothetical protein